jgi:hypothetical protein
MLLGTMRIMLMNFDNDAPAFADLNDPDHFDLVAAPPVEIAGVDDDNVNGAGVDNVLRYYHDS